MFATCSLACLNVGYCAEMTFLQGKFCRYLKILFNLLQFEVYSTQMKTVLVPNSTFRLLSQDIHPACPQRRSILHNCLCLGLLKCILICKPVHLFLNSSHYSAYTSISINNFIFKHGSIDCRSKMNSIKPERFDGVYWKIKWKTSICLFLSFYN